MKKRRMGSNRIKRLITVRPDTRKNLRKKLCLLKTFKKEFVEKTTIVVAVRICLTVLTVHCTLGSCDLQQNSQNQVASCGGKLR